MAVTGFQQAICRLVAANRIDQGEAYVAGGVALNLLTEGGRISRDIDLFHDTLEALDATWQGPGLQPFDDPGAGRSFRTLYDQRIGGALL